MTTPSIYGIDFTSAPRRAKPITVARLAANAEDRYALVGVESLVDWPSFDAFLARPGPWVAGFDLPFGLPRALVEALGWSRDWQSLMRHYAALDRATIRTTFKAYCAARPAGSKFAHRAADRPAGSSSSMKWVNPPVAWMLHAGVPRLIAARVSMPGLNDRDAAVDRTRIALEAYPGYLARSITRASYKSDTRALQTAARRSEWERIVDALQAGRHGLSLVVDMDGPQRTALVDDGGADRLDAVLCAVEAAWALRCHQAGHPRYGLPDAIDPLEGWIVGVAQSAPVPVVGVGAGVGAVSITAADAAATPTSTPSSIETSPS